MLIETSLPMVINRLAELPREVVPVLDDYRFVTEDDCHASVAFFVEHLPGNAHLVISSRADPPLPLGRLRARGEMNEIHTEQLAFSEEEAECLLNEKMELDIGPDDLCVLLEVPKGGLRGSTCLPLIAEQGGQACLHSLLWSTNRYVVDLLGEEVLAGLHEEVREFLLMTSAVDSRTTRLNSYSPWYRIYPEPVRTALSHAPHVACQNYLRALCSSWSPGTAEQSLSTPAGSHPSVDDVEA
jgi:LuxR family transcriptional regulator, maltose regulon positive regulatory protein